MATTTYTSWATDLTELGVVYPFAGTEVLMTILCVIFWIGFHVLQTRMENEEIAEELKTITTDGAKRSIGRY